MYSIKSLSPNDVDLMRSLLNLFGEVFDEPDTYCDKQPDNTYLQELLGKDHFFAVVACDGDKVVGGLTAYELQKYEQERSEIYIYDLAVHAEYRRKGIATGLINQVRDIGVDRGAYVVIIQADYGDEPAIALYNKLGKQEEVLHFDINVNH